MANGKTAIDGLSGSGKAGAGVAGTSGNDAALLAEIGKLGRDFAAHLAKSVFRDADAAGFGDALEPCGDIDAVAEDIVPLDQYVAAMDADAPFHAAFGGYARIALRRQLLQCQGALHGADHRAELDQHAVAGGLDDPPAMMGDERIGGSAMLAQCLCGARFVEPHQPAVAGHIGGENSGETAYSGDFGHWFPLRPRV